MNSKNIDKELSAHLFIEARKNYKHRLFIKTISLIVTFSFIYQQAAFGLYNVLSPIPASAPQTAKVTNYDFVSYNEKESEAKKLLPTTHERSETNSFSPDYVKKQQDNHSDIMQMKQSSEDMSYRINNKSKPVDEELPLQKKRSGGGFAGKIFYTLEGFDKSGKPNILNKYVYGVDGRLAEIISYDVSGIDVSQWQSGARHLKTKDGDKILGSSRDLPDGQLPAVDRILSKTVYFGSNGNEKVDYVLTGYGEDGQPSKVMLYVYDKPYPDTDGAITEADTYNISNLNIDFTSVGWKDGLSNDRLVEKIGYTGAAKAEKVSYILEDYFIGTSGVNSPGTVRIYDYNKDGNGDNLDETRSYDISETAMADWFTEDAARLVSITEYQGAKDKEQIKYVISDYVTTNDEYRPWERTDYTYDGDAMAKAETFNISGIAADSVGTMGSGLLESQSFFTGVKTLEKISYSYSLYDDSGNPTRRTDYIYTGIILASTETYDIAGASLNSKDTLVVRNLYEGDSGRERVSSTISYGTTKFETDYTYQENNYGIYYVSHSTEKTYSADGTLTERVETDNDLNYLGTDGSVHQDENGDIRNQTVKTYYLSDGVETLMTEEHASYKGYEKRGEAGSESITFYNYNDQGQKISATYQEITNGQFDARGDILKQTIYNYNIDESGSRVFESIMDITNSDIDYYGNILERHQTIYSDLGRSQLSDHTVTINTYGDLLAERKGNASVTTVTRFSLYCMGIPP